MYKKFLKRLIDFVIALCGLPFFAIIFVIVAPLIYFEDKGTIFYKAPRVGKDKKVFQVYKFRSMKVNAPDIRNKDGSTYNGEDDPRVTKIGKILRKTSIDETAQILNVLKGDMSIIGPRPATTKIFENLDELKEARFTVYPGITGYTQMKYRNSAQGKVRYECDKYYAENISFLLDLKIVFGTVKKVLDRSGLYNEVSTQQTEVHKEEVNK